MHHHFISTDCDQHKTALRRIRSFVRRNGRITQRQQHALDTLWPVMGTNYQAQPLNLDVLFGRSRPVTMDIGFGSGSYLVNMAAAHPEKHFLGIEVHLPGVGACLASAQAAGISNLRLICHDAVEVLEQMIPDMSIALVQLWFPDPWHKARHNKRRIIQSPFVELVGRKLSNNGVLHIATDWQPYAEHMLSILSNAEFFRNLSSTGDYVPRPEDRPFTHFEQRGQRLGHGIRDLMFKKCS